MTLVEVLFASGLVLMAVAAGLMTLSVTAETSHASAQHTTAMCLCQDLYETIRSTDFADITTAHFPSENNLPLTHTEAPTEVIVRCNRIVAITDESEPHIGAKRIVITVTWRFMGRDQQERLEGIIYDL